MAPTSHRMTITIPQDLRKRMDAAGEQINWSATAASAFEVKLFEIESRKETKNMDDVVARMKAAGELESKEAYDEGLAAGMEWAKSIATPKMLQRLDRWVATFQNSSVNWWEDAPGGWDAAGRFISAIRPDLKGERDAADQFWEWALGEDDKEKGEDEDFLHGFGDGAIAVWEEVSGQL